MNMIEHLDTDIYLLLMVHRCTWNEKKHVSCTYDEDIAILAHRGASFFCAFYYSREQDHIFCFWWFWYCQSDGIGA